MSFVEQKMQETRPGFIINTFFKNGEHRIIDETLGDTQIYLDGFAEYNNQKFAYEYNGCSFHFCSICGSNPHKKAKEEQRQR